ncbi:hypothetical protein E5555_05320 [Lactococcus lactis]|uniref:hypothetical protein n=1 Tax=Lactococcus lactis TaxID=1358 RepID=UPI00109CCA58|nr:hypothetical protein [Lactococcus lactis]THA54536.1 hypothetical protein E5555_05320 [Lactococcus lactis]
MMKQTRCYGCDKPIEPEWLPEGEFIVCDECSSDTDELSVEKLQEIRVEELKDFNSKILQAELKNQKLQEQLNTAKYFFKNILDVNPNLNKGHVSHLENCVRVMKNSAEKALAAIGGDDD